MSVNDQISHLKQNHFFEFKLAHLLTMLLLAGFGISWWMKHEDISNRADAAQTQMLQAHEKRFETNERRIDELQKAQNEIIPDIREIRTKLNVVAELIDAEHRRPE